MKLKDLEQVLFLLLVTALFAWVIWKAQSFARLARLFPQTVAIIALPLAVAGLVRALIMPRHVREAEESSLEGGLRGNLGFKSSLGRRFVAATPFLLWIGSFYAMIYLVGLTLASGLFVFFFVTFVGKMRWYIALGATFLLLTLLLILANVMNLHFPPAYVDHWLSWRFR